MAGNSRRLTAISKKTTAAATVYTHHIQPRCGTVRTSSASTAITPVPNSTSSEKAPARASQDAGGTVADGSSAGALGVASRTAVTT